MAGAILAMGGCTTTFDGGLTTGQPYSNKSTTTGSSSANVQQTRDPAKVSNCAKFDSMPQECERALGGY